MGILKKKFRSIKKLPDWIYIFPELLVRLWKSTCRVKIHDPYNHIESTEGLIVLLWHNRLLFFPLLFPLATRKRTVALISPSRDGQYIADFARRFGVRALRGSSNKRGALAQRAAVHELENGYNVVFTPDGPRGPKYRLSRGPVHLAMLTGHRIIPVAVNCSRYWQLKSWDNFQLPKPFCRIDLTLGQAVTIPSGLSDEELENERLRVEKLLTEVTRDRDL